MQMHSCQSLWAALLLATIAALVAPQVRAALTYDQAVELLLQDLSRSHAGKTLFAEDFESGDFHRWDSDPDWTVRDCPDMAGKCAQVVASGVLDYQDLTLKAPVPIAPGHPIAVVWRSRLVSGDEPLWLRVDFFDENGKPGKPNARQQPFGHGSDWSPHVLLVSDWFPEYTRAIRLQFFLPPNVQTTCLLDDVRILDLDAAARQLMELEWTNTLAMCDRTAREAARLPASPVNDYWKGVAAPALARAREALTACSALERGSREYAGRFDPAAVTVARFADAVGAAERGRLQTTRILVYRTTPISPTMILPHSTDLPGEIASQVRVSACPGEYECASLVLWAPEAIPSLSVAATNLVGGDGVIPAANVDVKWVKCWYQGCNAPYGVRVEREKKTLIPELLLNDDSLVKVDYETQHNYLKLSFPEGPKYVPIDDPTPVPWGNRYSLEEFPVKDSPVLLPTELSAGENKQVWITVHVPDDAAPGLYEGDISVRAGDSELAVVRLKLRVLPLRLVPPKTHYDADREFTYSLYYWGELDPEGKGTIGHKYKSAEQLRAELGILHEHGIVAPAVIWGPDVVYEDESLFRRNLEIARDVGMAGRPLYLADSGLVGNPTEPLALRRLQQRIRRAITVAREYGFTGIYFYGIDEAVGDRLLSQRTAWQAVHQAGGKVWVSGGPAHFQAVGDLLDQLNHAGDPHRADPAGWHERGHTIWNYGHPQTPVELPEAYRRNYGLLLWELDFDGACTYCFMDSEGRPWNDFDGPHYRGHMLAYPTVNGVVGTLALEGFREGVDDVRYAVTLRAFATDAIRSGNPRAAAAGQAALKWLAELDPESGDLDTVRRAIIRHILRIKRHQGD